MLVRAETHFFPCYVFRCTFADVSDHQFFRSIRRRQIMSMTNANADKTRRNALNGHSIVSGLCNVCLFPIFYVPYASFFIRLQHSECLEKWKILQEMLVYSLEKCPMKTLKRVRKRDGCLYPGGKTISIAALCITSHTDIFRLKL